MRAIGGVTALGSSPLADGVRLAVIVTAAGAYSAASLIAIGAETDRSTGIVGGAVGLLLVLLTGPDRRLSLAERRRIRAAERTGDPTGDPRLDRILDLRRRRAERRTEHDRVVVPLLLVLLGSVPVLAAVRDSHWWLLCLAYLPLVALDLSRRPASKPS
jgi:hypothetical protein